MGVGVGELIQQVPAEVRSAGLLVVGEGRGEELPEGMEEGVLELGGLDGEEVGFGRGRRVPDAGGAPAAYGAPAGGVVVALGRRVFVRRKPFLFPFQLPDVSQPGDLGSIGRRARMGVSFSPFASPPGREAMFLAGRKGVIIELAAETVISGIAAVVVVSVVVVMVG